MFKLSALVLNNVVIGLRFKTPEGNFDAGNISLRALGVYNLDIPAREELKPHFGGFMTQEEINSGVEAEEISDSPVLTEYVRIMRNVEKFNFMFKYQAPYEQSVEQFLVSGWEPVRDQRNDEHNGQHHLKKPDGSKWRGGWIGKGRSNEVVLKNFHFEQCYWYMHRGGKLAQSALNSHPKLKEYAQIISYIRSKIPTSKVEGGQISYTTMTAPLTTGEPDLIIEPMQLAKASPYQVRGYFTNLDYDKLGIETKDFKLHALSEGFGFDLREITYVAYLGLALDLLNAHRHLHHVYD